MEPEQLREVVDQHVKACVDEITEGGREVIVSAMVIMSIDPDAEATPRALITVVGDADGERAQAHHVPEVLVAAAQELARQSGPPQG